MKEMVALILNEVREKEDAQKSEGIDFFQDLIDPTNEEFISYFQIKEENDGVNEVEEVDED